MQKWQRVGHGSLRKLTLAGSCLCLWSHGKSTAAVGILTNAAADVPNLPPEQRRLWPASVDCGGCYPWGGHQCYAPEVEALLKKRVGNKLKISQRYSSPPQNMAFIGCTKRPCSQSRERRSPCIDPQRLEGQCYHSGTL